MTLRGRNLKAMDSGGTSDPYVVVTVGRKKHQTKAVHKTLDPEWKHAKLKFPSSKRSLQQHQKTAKHKADAQKHKADAQKHKAEAQKQKGVIS